MTPTLIIIIMPKMNIFPSTSMGARCVTLINMGATITSIRISTITTSYFMMMIGKINTISTLTLMKNSMNPATKLIPTILTLMGTTNYSASISPKSHRLVCGIFFHRSNYATFFQSFFLLSQ